MNNMEYYKSLISEDEVIKALVKESKAREGEPFKEKTRVRPNLNFFQRTVTNLVSSNKRITTIPDFTPKERNKYVGKVKTPHALMKEILMTNKIDFVKSEESKGTEYVKKSRLVDAAEENLSSNDLNEPFHKSDSPPKLSPKSGPIHFNLNFDKHKIVNSTSSIGKDFSKYEKRKPSSSSDSSDDSIISISSTESVSSTSSSSSSSVDSDVVISISDSEDSSSNKPEPFDKSEKFFRKKCKKKKLQKKRKKRKDV